MFDVQQFPLIERCSPLLAGQCCQSALGQVSKWPRYRSGGSKFIIPGRESPFRRSSWPNGRREGTVKCCPEMDQFLKFLQRYWRDLFEWRMPCWPRRRIDRRRVDGTWPGTKKKNMQNVTFVPMLWRRYFPNVRKLRSFVGTYAAHGRPILCGNRTEWPQF